MFEKFYFFELAQWNGQFMKTKRTYRIAPVEIIVRGEIVISISRNGLLKSCVRFPIKWSGIR